MSMRIGRRTLLAGAAALVATRPAMAQGAVHDVEMLNTHPENRRLRMVFHPRLIVIEPGDMVRFLPTDRGHNSASIDGMLPEGAESWQGRLNQQVDVTLPDPGFYGYQCTPHVSLGMVGLIVVRGDGMHDNLEAARAVRQRGRAAAIWDEIWAEAEADGLLS